MKKYTLQTVTASGDVVAEDELLLESSDTIIFSPPEKSTLEVTHKIHAGIKRSLESGAPVITVPAGSKIQVLRIK